MFKMIFCIISIFLFSCSSNDNEDDIDQGTGSENERFCYLDAKFSGYIENEFVFSQEVSGCSSSSENPIKSSVFLVNREILDSPDDKRKVFSVSSPDFFPGKIGDGILCRSEILSGSEGWETEADGCVCNVTKNEEDNSFSSMNRKRFLLGLNGSCTKTAIPKEGTSSDFQIKIESFVFKSFISIDL